MTPARVCATAAATVGFAILFILILATRNTPTTAATINTTTFTTTSTTTTTTSTTTKKHVVYFEAKKNSNQTNSGPVHVVTFDHIPINVGGGMLLNGSFIAPVAGVYW